MDIISNPKVFVELFHILFMEQLSQKLDKRLYALKGGCNLRFFLGSIRYSEDIDIDVHTVAPVTLKNTVDKILSAVSFKHLLHTQRMSIESFSTPKQTTTTQRWKIQLKTSAQSLPLNTKIEFSRRNVTSNAITATISRDLISAYRLRPIFISHYPAEIALEQKIDALIHRNETQARDIFDIHHILQTTSASLNRQFKKNELQEALKNIMNIAFAIFKSQVVSYLESDHQVQYNDQEIWNAIVVTVYEYIEKQLS